MSALHEVGIAYCLEHAGTRNEDESGHCDWFNARCVPTEDVAACRLVPLLFADDAEVEIVEPVA